ncbi:MAG: type II secretion system protein [Candidatus Woykebacteria bacterium]
MKMRSKQSQNGFTLVELLVVTAVIGILAIISATVFNSILRSQNKTAVINEVRQNGNLAIDKLDRDVKQASEVTLVDDLQDGDITDGDATSIKLTTDQGLITWECDDIGLTINRNVASVLNTDSLNGVRLVAGSCRFVVSDPASTTTQLVKFEFRLQQGSAAPARSEFEVNEPFEATIGTRSYQ